MSIARFFKSKGFKTESKYISGVGYVVDVSNGTDAFNGSSQGCFVRLRHGGWHLEKHHSLNKVLLSELLSLKLGVCW